jgi:hypothetical protein
LAERVDMQTGILTPLFGLVLLSVAAVIVSKIRSRNASSRRDVLKRRLRKITAHNQAKTDRLIEFERAELIRNRRPKENLDALMDRAIKRWERDNAFAVSIY